VDASGWAYVAWTERTVAGNNRVYVKTFNGTAWALVGSGSLNNNVSSGWAYRPSLVSDSASESLYLGWVEQQALGEPAQIYVSRYSGGVWNSVGSSLNVDRTRGSAQHVSLAVSNGQVVAAWGEVIFGGMRQIFAKQWNGSAWTTLSGSNQGTTTPPVENPAISACDLNRDGKVDILDVQLSINQALQIAACTTADLQHTGRCDIVDVQRVINNSLGGPCVSGQ
jgi:hypothetical protein